MRLRWLSVLFLTLFVGISLQTIYVLESHEKEGRTAEIGTLRDFKVQRNSTVVSTRRYLAFDEACPPLYEPVTPVLSSIPQSLTSNASTSEPLFTYNPTIHKFHGSDEATYIASFRVGTYPWLQKDYLGLALMDGQLKIIKSVVLDVNLYATVQYAAKKRHANEPPLFSDYRLVWYNSTYFVTNSIAILVLSIGNTDDTSNTNPIPIVFDGGLSVRAVSPVRKIRRVTKGRNFNFYTTQQQQLLLEEWPLPTPRYVGTGRKVSSIRIFDDWRFDALESWESTNAAPEPSFQGPDAAFDRKGGNICDDRGTVCCVQLGKEYYQDLTTIEDDYILIGISHVKSFKRIRMSHGEKYAYLSRFYAVRPTIPPTEIVAQSGLFCWTGGTDKERMEWNGVVYDCPVIQFPSGMTESATDSSVLLVAYGINDVTARIVQIKKRDVATLLFGSLAEV